MSSKLNLPSGSSPDFGGAKVQTKIKKLTEIKKKKRTFAIFLQVTVLFRTFAASSRGHFRARPRRTYIHSPPHAETSETTYIQLSIH